MPRLRNAVTKSSELNPSTEMDTSPSRAGLSTPPMINTPSRSAKLVKLPVPEHPLATEKSVLATDIEGQRFITFTKTPEPDQEFARLFRPERRYPVWTASVELPEAIIELVPADQGTSILAQWAVEPHVAAGRIMVIALEPKPILMGWNCEFRGDEPEANPVRQVASALSDWFSS